MIAVSVVSHGQIEMIFELLRLLESSKSVQRIFVTLNSPKEFDKLTEICEFKKTTFFLNLKESSFAANHNFAAVQCRENLLCIINPDVGIDISTFELFVERCAKSQCFSVYAPLLVSFEGALQDCWRKWPLPGDLLGRWFLGRRSIHFSEPDWASGALLIVNRNIFLENGGFDSSYRMYCEDVDLFYRYRRAGLMCKFDNEVSFAHTGNHQSHRNLRYFFWHLRSLVIFNFKYFRDYLLK